NIDRGAGGDLGAGLTDTAGVGRRAVDAVERLGEQAGGSGLAHPAWTAEEVGVGDPVQLDGIGHRADHVLLPGHVVEGLGAPLPRQDEVTHRKWGYTLAGLTAPPDAASSPPGQGEPGSAAPLPSSEGVPPVQEPGSRPAAHLPGGGVLQSWPLRRWV